MSARAAVAILLSALLAGACGEGQFFDEIEARSCPVATLLPQEAPASGAVVLSLESYDCELGALRILVDARNVGTGVTMVYVELLDVREPLILRDAIGGPFPSRGASPFFSTVRPVEDAPNDYLLVNGSLAPSSDAGGTVLTLDFDLARLPFRDEVVVLEVDPQTSAVFGSDYRPRAGITFVGARVRFR